MRLVNERRLTEAKRSLRAALRATTDSALEARILGTLAYALAESGDAAQARELATRAIDSPGIDDRTAAILAGQMGSLAERSGDYEGADRWLTRAIGMLSDASPETASLLMTRANLEMQRRQLAAALEDLGAARRIFTDHDMAVRAAQAEHNEGYIALLAGDLVNAMRTMARARSVLADVSPAALGTCDMDRAGVLRDAGLVSEAEHLFAQAADVFGDQGLPRDRAEAEFQLALSQLRHDPASARATSRRAARHFRSAGIETWALRADAVGMRAALSGGRISSTGRRTAGEGRVPADGDVERVIAALTRRGLRTEAAALRLTRDLWRTRRASTTLARSSGRLPAAAPLEVRLLQHEVGARRAERRGRPADARRRAADGLELLQERHRDFGSLDLQTSIAMHASGLLEIGLATAVAGRNPREIFDWSERARHLSLQVVPLRPPPDPELAQELAELRMLRARGGDWLGDPRVRQLQERFRERQWTETGGKAVEQRVTLDEACAVLDDDTALVSYVFTGSGVTGVIATRDRVELIPGIAWESLRTTLSGLRADLDMAAAVRAGPLAASVQHTLQGRLAALSALLMEGPMRRLTARRLVITVPAALSGIPWAMLPGMRGRVFTLAGSATRWVRSRGEATAPVARAAFAWGPHVRRGPEEISAAASAWPDPQIVREHASTVAQVTDLARGADLLHIAAHGRHSADNPMFSGLEFADGALFGYDVDQIPAVPRTVVLSACEVGRSSIRWGEESVGMTRIWLHAGTRAVIAAPVVVADDDACELLAEMHAGTAAGLGPSEALSAASESTGIVAPFQVHGAGF